MPVTSVAGSVLNAIGGTPVVRLRRIVGVGESHRLEVDAGRGVVRCLLRPQTASRALPQTDLWRVHPLPGETEWPDQNGEPALSLVEWFTLNRVPKRLGESIETGERLAPSASRIPTSCTRCDTACALTARHHTEDATAGESRALEQGAHQQPPIVAGRAHSP